MSLNATNIASGNTIKAADIHQFYDLFTGAMTDQPVIFANTANVGGSHAAGSAVLTVTGAAGQSGPLIQAYHQTGDTQPIFQVDSSGGIHWGAGGGSAADVALTRLSAGILDVSQGTFGIAGGLTYVGLYSNPALSGNVSQYGAAIYANSSSGATGSLYGVYTQIKTAVAAFTCVTGVGLYVDAPVLGAGSAITNVYGIYVNAQAGGGTNYALYTGGGLVQFQGYTGINAAPTSGQQLLVQAQTDAWAGVFKGLVSAGHSYGLEVIGGSTSADICFEAVKDDGATTYMLIRGDGLTQFFGPTLGFYSQTPTTQQLLPTGASKTVDNVITALQNLGLVKQA